MEESTEQSIGRLIERLDSPRFSERARATLELQRLGPAAIESLEKVVVRGSSEAAGRALGILKRNFLSDNEQLSAPAREALQRIAELENHPSALQAQRILTPPEPKPSAARPRQVPMPAVPMNQQIQVQIKSVNGQREIKINENGREFRFRDDGDGIAVERPDGQGGVKKDRYKDKGELKEKDPAAHKMYERYAGQGNRIQFQIGDPFRRGFPGFQIRPRNDIRPRRSIPEIRRPQPPTPRPAPPQRTPKPKLDDIIEV
jgi:hypothetical protein